jgi:hypothetical protein
LLREEGAKKSLPELFQGQKKSASAFEATQNFTEREYILSESRDLTIPDLSSES